MMNWTWQRILMMSVLLALVAAGLIWVAWELEEGKKPVRTRVVEESADGNFVVEIREQESYDLIVHCDEEKFQEAFEKFTDHAQVESKYPPLRVPGGPMVIALADLELPEELQPARRTAVEYLRRHAPRRVVLVAHSECLLYDSIAAWQDDLDGVKRRQHEHLVDARHAILRWFPDTEVELYYADKSGNRMTFYNMAEELPPSSIAAGEETGALPGN
jgi:hypothetical protein